MSTLLNKLPEITFAEKDPSVIDAEVKSYFEELLGIKLYDGDPKRLFLSGFCKYLALQRSEIDFSGKQNLLRYSTDGFIQHLGALVDVYISEPTKAVTVLEFTLSAALASNTVIKKGTRVTGGDKVYFATVEDIEIPAGELSTSAAAECTEAGVVGNGYLPGKLNQLSDPFPYNCMVRNLTITEGGADREGVEAFRERIHEAPEALSAGTIGAYRFWAKSVSPLIADVSVKTPSPGVVEIIPLLADGEMPGQSLLDKVYDACADDARRGFTDCVVVRAPEIIRFSAQCKYYVSRSDAAAAASLYNKTDEAKKEFVIWQKSALGRDINPSKLTEMLMKTGIKRVETGLEYKKLQYYQIAVAENLSLEYGGLEDD